MKIKSGTEEIQDHSAMLEQDDGFEDLLASLIPDNVLQNEGNDLFLNPSLLPPNTQTDLYQQPPDNNTVYRFRGASNGMITTRPSFRDVRHSMPPPGAGSHVQNSEKEEIRQRIIKRRYNEQITGYTQSNRPSTSAQASASCDDGDGKGGKQKPSKNAEQAKKNRLKKKEEERQDNLQIERLDLECQEHEKRNNSLRSEIMGHQAERSRLEKAILSDPDLSYRISLQPRDGVIDTGRFSPTSGGICLSVTDPTAPAQLCELCSQRFCACSQPPTELAQLSPTADDTWSPLELHDPPNMMSL